jgi:hypothetical protein
MSIPGKILLITMALLIYLALFAVGTGLALFVADIVFFGLTSGLLKLAAWFVAAVFCGILTYGYADEQMPGSGWLIIGVSACVLVALSVVFYYLFWERDWDRSDYIPVNGAGTITWFLMILGTMFFARALSDTPRPPPAR